MNLPHLEKFVMDYLGEEITKEWYDSIIKISPITGCKIGAVRAAEPLDVLQAIQTASLAFKFWRTVPAPQRGEYVRILGDLLRRDKDKLGKLVTIESGKILSEGLGEVQEMIDICDFAVGLSRQLYGLTMPSERRNHRLQETWHPLGVVGCITAFNFPVAVWAWNFAISTVCGNTMVWKPSEKAPLVAEACFRLATEAMNIWEESTGIAGPRILHVVQGGDVVGKALVNSTSVSLVSATGSTAMGRHVTEAVGKRMGRCLLELGGNNAMIVTPSADLDLAVKAIVFSAVGTCGQRCTTLRRVIVHKKLKTKLVNRVKKAYDTLKIGDPTHPDVLVGPLIDKEALDAMKFALTSAGNIAGTKQFGGGILDTESNAYRHLDGGAYVDPAIIVFKQGQPHIMKQETFAPILYITEYEEFVDAIEMQNDVAHGLSSCIFTNDIREAELFMRDSDCGLANINIGTSGAEIGAAFGGEKETGGGREAGSDSWKQYMRRATNTINYGTDMPLAQGVKFD